MGVVAAMILRAAPAAAQPSSSPAQPLPAESAEQAIQRDLEQQRQILTSPDSKPEQREQAAQRLVLRQRADARDILLKVLTDPEPSNRPARIAVAWAVSLALDPSPDPRFVDPLLNLLDPDASSTDAAVRALAKYSEDAHALTELIAFAKKPGSIRSRATAVRGIGAFIKKRAAAFLIELINNPDEEPALRSAGFDALADMTSINQFGADLRQWNAWWNQTQNQADADWELNLIKAKARLVGQMQQEVQRIASRVKSLMKKDYQRTADGPARTELVLGWLKEGEPVFRAVAAEIVWEQIRSAEAVAPAVVEQLRGMIGDSSVEVRRQVIITLKERKDESSIDPLLAQLAVETEPDVKIAIAQMLGLLKNVKAVEALLALLNDPSSRVAESAADSLRALGDLIRQDPAGLAAKVADALRTKLRAAETQPGSSSLRAALLEALAPLQRSEMLNTFIEALRESDTRNSVKVRIAACRGLARLTEPREREQAATALVGALLRDRDAAVRLAAVKALGSVGTFAQAAALHDAMGPRELDKSVREAAWAALAGDPEKEDGLLFHPDAPASTLLNTWALYFKEDAEKRLTVRQAARKKLVANATDADVAKTLASLDQDIGQDLSDLNRWDKAVASFRNSFAYYQRRGTVPPQLSTQLLVALLRSGAFTDATQFASERIKAEPQEQQDIGFRLRSEVERLLKATDKTAAGQLIDEIEKMQPPLKNPFLDQIRNYRERLK